MTRESLPSGRALATAIAIALANPTGTFANTISVTDSCTLANAIASANSNTVIGGCVPGGSGADTIVLTVDVALAGELPLIVSDMAFDGGLHSIDGGLLYRLFFI